METEKHIKPEINYIMIKLEPLNICVPNNLIKLTDK